MTSLGARHEVIDLTGEDDDSSSEPIVDPTGGNDSSSGPEEVPVPELSSASAQQYTKSESVGFISSARKDETDYRHPSSGPSAKTQAKSGASDAHTSVSSSECDAAISDAKLARRARSRNDRSISTSGTPSSDDDVQFSTSAVLKAFRIGTWSGKGQTKVMRGENRGISNLSAYGRSNLKRTADREIKSEPLQPSRTQSEINMRLSKRLKLLRSYSIEHRDSPVALGRVSNGVNQTLPVQRNEQNRPFSSADDRVIIDLKKNRKLTWSTIASHFPGCSPGALQTHYLTSLAHQDRSATIGIINESNGQNSHSGIRHISVQSTTSLSSNLEDAPSLSERARSVEDEAEEAKPLAGRQLPSSPTDIEVPKWTVTSGKDEEALPETLQAQDRGSSLQEIHPKHRRRRALGATEGSYLGMRERASSRPSLSATESDNGLLPYWDSAKLRGDFNDKNMNVIRNSLAKVDRETVKSGLSSAMLRKQAETYFGKLSERAMFQSGSWRRSSRSKESFFQDMLSGSPLSKQSPHSKPLSLGPFLRSRELGVVRRRQDRAATHSIPQDLQRCLHDTLGPWLTFTGTSGDVGTVAWSPSGMEFAAGSVALTDPASMQYNQPNNLLLGSISQKSVKELPDHVVPRKKPPKGINATDSMHRSQVSLLYTTVSIVRFSPDGELMYSTGYDEILKAWDLRTGSEEAACLWSFPHKASIDLLTVGDNGLLATGSQRPTTGSIKVIKPESEGKGAVVVHTFHSKKATDKPDTTTFPSCLAFGAGWSKNRLLAGFSSTSAEVGKDSNGETCLWDVETGQQLPVGNARNIFDCAWHPNKITFAVGSVAGSGVNRGTHSVVRLYDPRMAGQRCTSYTNKFELECPSYDMNDLVCSPYDDNLISASCTSGKCFVWDLRNPDDILHTFKHGRPLIELAGQDIRDREDTGVRFTSYGHARDRFYTGSSDGVVKSWDPYRNSEDVWVRDVISCKSGIMSGAFSPDFSNLLLGEVNGTINVLALGCHDLSLKEAETLRLERATHLPEKVLIATSSEDESTLGIRTANELLASGQMMLQPLGSLPIRQAVQGPNYTGPHMKDLAEAVALRAQAASFQKRFKCSSDVQCPIDHSGDHPKLTEEERGDSGRSRDRMPHALRFPLRPENAKGKTAKCDVCRLPALASDAGRVRCERCAFSCLRCGADAEFASFPSENEDFLACRGCKIPWRVDCLGFTQLDCDTGKEVHTDIIQREDGITRRDDEDDVEWYYHSQWEASWI